MKTCVWDLETHNLRPNFGVMLCACIKPYGKKPIAISKGRVGINDKQLVKTVRDELKKYDILIGFYSLGFDLKFLNSRLMHWGYKPLLNQFHIDVYRLAKRLVNTHRRNLDTVSKFLGIKGKNHINAEDWMRAALEGDNKALKKIITHCKYDVIVTEQVFDRLKDCMRSISKI